MSASIGNEYYPNEIENGIAFKGNNIEKMQSLQRNRPPIGRFYMKCVQNVPSQYDFSFLQSIFHIGVYQLMALASKPLKHD